LAPGAFTITVSSQKIQATAKLFASPIESITLKTGRQWSTISKSVWTFTISAIGVLGDGATIDVTTLSTWSSSNEQLATTSAGVVTLNTDYSGPTGEVTITAVAPGGASASVTWNVINGYQVLSISSIAPASLTLPIGAEQQMLVDVLATDGSTEFPIQVSTS